VALNKTTGADIWKFGGSDLAGYSTPVTATIGGKKQYVVFVAKALIGVDAASGALLWRQPWETQYDVNASSPVVIGNTVFISSNYGRGCALVKIEGEKASIVWENRKIKEHFASAILSGGLLYSTSDPGEITCMDPASGTPKWTQRGFEKGGMVAVDGALIVLDGANGDVALVKINPEKYEELGRIKPLGGDQSWTAPIIADGKLFIRNKKALVALELK
jgi:outer membrane protein assembly factor BamB